MMFFAKNPHFCVFWIYNILCLVSVILGINTMFSEKTLAI